MSEQTDLKRIEWYISHRLEHLEITLKQIEDKILQTQTLDSGDLEFLRTAIENKGRVKELRQLLAWIKQWV